MHQSGHSRAHSMQTVQFSSNSADDAAGAGRQFGLRVRVLRGDRRWVIVRRVTARPLARPDAGDGSHG